MSEEKLEDLVTSTEDQEDVEEDYEETTDVDSYEREELTDREKQFLARAKKAEAKAKEAKAKPIKKTNTESTLSRDEAILFAKGHTEEEVGLALKLAKLNEVSVSDAITDEIFIAKVNSRKKIEQEEKASLGASKGNSKVITEKPIGEMSKDEHMEFFNKNKAMLG